MGRTRSENKSSIITRWIAKRHLSGATFKQFPDRQQHNRGYRAGWQTILGAFPPEVIEDNTNPWSGDHCMDYTLVPGVVLSNRKIAAENPALTDIAPTIFAEFGITKPSELRGKSIFGANGAGEN